MKRRRSRLFQIGQRDLNEPLITAVLDRYGIKYKLLPTGFGADILIFDWMAFVEVKNPTRPPSGRRLTDDELELQAFCAEAGKPYFVVETPERMVEIFGQFESALPGAER